MAHTNRGRVILGGLLAGVVINVVEYVTNGIVLREAWGRAMQALGKPADLSAGAIVIFNVWGFLLGIAAVWIYAGRLCAQISSSQASLQARSKAFSRNKKSVGGASKSSP